MRGAVLGKKEGLPRFRADEKWLLANIAPDGAQGIHVGVRALSINDGQEKGEAARSVE